MRNGSAVLVYNDLSPSAIFRPRIELESIDLSQHWVIGFINDSDISMVHDNLSEPGSPRNLPKGCRTADV